jgi:hypothetical protein
MPGLPPDTFRFILEGLKVIAMIALLFVLLRAGRRYPQISTTSWQWIIVGFVMMLVAFAVGFGGELIDYDASYMLSLFAIFIEEGGLISGLFLVAMGFSTWFEFVARFLGLKARE